MTTLIERTPAEVATDCRISLRQPINRAGSVDGARWPRSKDLAAELPALVEVFWTDGRGMSRVIYNLDSWDGAPRKIAERSLAIAAEADSTSSAQQMIERATA